MSSVNKALICIKIGLMMFVSLKHIIKAIFFSSSRRSIGPQTATIEAGKLVTKLAKTLDYFFKTE